MRLWKLVKSRRLEGDVSSLAVTYFAGIVTVFVAYVSFSILFRMPKEFYFGFVLGALGVISSITIAIIVFLARIPASPQLSKDEYPRLSGLPKPPRAVLPSIEPDSTSHSLNTIVHLLFQQDGESVLEEMNRRMKRAIESAKLGKWIAPMVVRRLGMNVIRPPTLSEIAVHEEDGYGQEWTVSIRCGFEWDTPFSMELSSEFLMNWPLERLAGLPFSLEITHLHFRGTIAILADRVLASHVQISFVEAPHVEVGLRGGCGKPSVLPLPHYAVELLHGKVREAIVASFTYPHVFEFSMEKIDLVDLIMRKLQ